MIKLFFSEILDIIVFSPYTQELHGTPNFVNFTAYLNSLGIYNVDINFRENLKSLDYINEIEKLDVYRQNICYRLFFEDAMKYFGIFDVEIEHNNTEIIDFIFLNLKYAVILFHNELRLFDSEFIFLDKLGIDKIEDMRYLEESPELYDALYQDYMNYISKLF